MAININISNYEEFLFSAIDGELSGEEMAALDAFMMQHPGIRKEYDLLQSARMTPDMSVTFGSRDILYKKTAALSAANYESFLLDYVDNELNAQDKAALETLISQHPHIQKDLAQLQATRLNPDLTVTFGNRDSLYRGKRNQVRPLWWWSAAAAVVVGLAIWLIPALRTTDESQLAVNKSGKPADAQTVTPQAGQQPATPLVADATKSARSKENNSPAAATTSADATNAMARTDVNSKTSGHTSTQATVAANNRNNGSVSDATANEKVNTDDNARLSEIRLAALAKIPQPASTSGEVVQQLQDKTEQQEKILAENVAQAAEKNAAAMATTTKIPEVAPAAAAASTPANSELVVAVTMNGDSKLLNGVANVARFLSRKKK